MQILLIEDDESIIRALTLQFTRVGHTVLVAKKKQQALSLFEQNPQVDIMLFDGWLHGELTDTSNLIAAMRANYTGPMIAMSSDPITRTQQLLAGCDLEMKKQDAVQFVLQMPNHPVPKHFLSHPESAQ